MKTAMERQRPGMPDDLFSFAGDLVAQCIASIVVRRVAGETILCLSTLGWAIATLLVPAALNSSFPREAHGVLQVTRGVLCGLGFPSAHAVVATTPPDARATALGALAGAQVWLGP